MVRMAPLLEKLKTTTDFPNVASTQGPLLEISIAGYQNTLKLLSEIQELNSTADQVIVKQGRDIFDYSGDVPVLRELLNRNGSDKASKHEYDLVYANLLENRFEADLDILEIGLGTNNTDTPSNMGKGGTPGASLRTWKDFFPNANIVGCDVDFRILFSEERIETFQLDQTSKDSWESLKSNLGDRRFNLIIDDGLHAPYANLRTLIEASELVKLNGYIVIEDVPDKALAMWKLIPSILEKKWEFRIIRGNVENLVIFRRLS